MMRGQRIEDTRLTKFRCAGVPMPWAQGPGVQIAPPRPKPLFSVFFLPQIRGSRGTAHLPPVQWTAQTRIAKTGLVDLPVLENQLAWLRVSNS